MLIVFVATDLSSPKLVNERIWQWEKPFCLTAAQRVLSPLRRPLCNLARVTEPPLVNPLEEAGRAR